MHDDNEISPHLKAWGAIAAVVLVLIGGISYYASDRAKTRERIRMEEARNAAAAAVARQQAAEAAQREAEEGGPGAHGTETRVVRSRRDASRHGSYSRSQDDTDSYGRQYDDPPRASEDRASEEGERYQAEADRQRAQGDVERQKRYVQQREEEEEAARNRRHDRVQQEARERAAGEAVPAAPPDTPPDPRVRKK